jgi:hypothetical protein
MYNFRGSCINYWTNMGLQRTYSTMYIQLFTTQVGQLRFQCVIFPSNWNLILKFIVTCFNCQKSDCRALWYWIKHPTYKKVTRGRKIKLWKLNARRKWRFRSETEVEEDKVDDVLTKVQSWHHQTVMWKDDVSKSQVPVKNKKGEL